MTFTSRLLHFFINQVATTNQIGNQPKKHLPAIKKLLKTLSSSRERIQDQPLLVGKNKGQQNCQDFWEIRCRCVAVVLLAEAHVALRVALRHAHVVHLRIVVVMIVVVLVGMVVEVIAMVWQCGDGGDDSSNGGGGFPPIGLHGKRHWSRLVQAERRMERKQPEKIFCQRVLSSLSPPCYSRRS